MKRLISLLFSFFLFLFVVPLSFATTKILNTDLSTYVTVQYNPPEELSYDPGSPPYNSPTYNVRTFTNPGDTCYFAFYATQNIADQIFGSSYPEPCPPAKGTLTFSQANNDNLFFGNRFSQGPPYGLQFSDTTNNAFYDTANEAGLNNGNPTLPLPSPLPPQPTTLHIYPLLGDSIGVGNTYNESGSFAEPNSNASIVNATVNYGDGFGEQTLTLYGPNFILSHRYTTPGTYTVTVSLTDSQGATATQIGKVNVYALPKVMLSNATVTLESYSTRNGGTGTRAAYTATGSFSDPDPNATSWTGQIFFGNGPYGPLTINGNTFSSSNINWYYQAGTYPVTVLITDNLGLTVTGKGTATVTVNNYTPTPTPPTRQIEFIHGLNTSYTVAQRCIDSVTGNPIKGFQTIWCKSPYENNVKFFHYYQDIGYSEETTGCSAQPTPDTAISPLYAPSDNGTNDVISSTTCDSQSATAYDATGLDDTLITRSSPVTIIDYSMGAAITRGWLTLAQSKPNDKTLNIVDTIISLQGAQHGSYLALGVLPFVNSLPYIAWSTPLATDVYFLALEEEKYTNLNPNRPAEADLTPGSDWYKSANKTNVPSNMHYFNFYSDIQYRALLKFFIFPATPITHVSFGDYLLLPEKASPTDFPTLGSSLFLPGGQQIADRHEYVVPKYHDFSYGDTLDAGWNAETLIDIPSFVKSDPQSHVNLNQYLDDLSVPIDSCKIAYGQTTIRSEILSILADPEHACD